MESVEKKTFDHTGTNNFVSEEDQNINPNETERTETGSVPGNNGGQEQTYPPSMHSTPDYHDDQDSSQGSTSQFGGFIDAFKDEWKSIVDGGKNREENTTEGSGSAVEVRNQQINSPKKAQQNDEEQFATDAIVLGAQDTYVKWIETVRAQMERAQLVGGPAPIFNAAFFGEEGTGADHGVRCYQQVLKQNGYWPQTGSSYNARDGRLEIMDVAAIIAQDPENSNALAKKIEQLPDDVGMLYLKNVDAAPPQWTYYKTALGNLLSGNFAPREYTEQGKTYTSPSTRKFPPIVVMQGVEQPVKDLLDTRGLDFDDLVPHRVKFEPLKGEPLFRILEDVARQNGYTLDEGAKTTAEAILRSQEGGEQISEDLFKEARTRQAFRLFGETDDRKVTKEEAQTLIGEDFQEKNTSKGEALARYKVRVGSEEIYEAVRKFVSQHKRNAERLAQGKSEKKVTTNMVLQGPNGTGKTTEVDFIRDILVEEGIRNSNFVVKNASDLCGTAVGEAEKLTKEALRQGIGGVIVVDEAHNLMTGGEQMPYGKKALETILTFAEEHREDTTVILLGYDGPMDELYRADQGFKRRFPNQFRKKSFKDAQLRSIMEGYAKEDQFEISEEAMDKLSFRLSQQRNSPHYGNAGSARNWYEKAVVNHNDRIRRLQEEGKEISEKEDSTITAEDVPGLSREESSNSNRLKDFVGFDHIEDQLKKFWALRMVEVQQLKESGLDPDEFQSHISPCFLISGPSGSGKKSLGEVLPEVFQSLGVADPNQDPVHINGADLTAQFEGQTTKHTRKLLDKAKGSVLVLSGLRSLLSGGKYEGEALAEVIRFLGEQKGKLVAAAIGDEDELRAFTQIQDIANLFQTELQTKNLDADQSQELFEKLLVRDKLSLDKKSTKKLPKIIEQLRKAPLWANGHDINALLDRARTLQASGWVERKGSREERDVIDYDSLNVALNELVEKKNQRAETQRQYQAYMQKNRNNPSERAQQ